MNAPDRFLTMPQEAAMLTAGALQHHPEAAPFEAHWDRPVRDQDLAGLTVEQALAKLDSALLDSVYSP